jgi:hypothetical protein
MTRTLVFDPLIAWPLIWALGALAAGLLALALWRGLKGWPWRGLALGLLALALTGPSLQEETRKPLSDIVLVIVDDSASQQLSDRPTQTAEALARVEAAIAALPNTEMRLHRFADGARDAGSLAMTALAQALASEPQARIAGAIVISDGRIHDAGLAPDMPAPLHLLVTGRPADWDRRLVMRDVPGFAIVGEEFLLKMKIEDQGAAPGTPGEYVDLAVTVDDGEPISFSVPVNEDLELPVRLGHGGLNVLHFSVPADPAELTARNNETVVQVNGVRDRLRVLLVSGEPHAGERVWRNLLKSDPSVDLVHFTILRPPEKQDGIPVEELALIAFPTRELFVEKIKEFDLIIFDRYRMRGILPMEYMDNIVSYVRDGGTVLVAAGPEYGAVDSLWRTPLAEILPAEPTSRVIEGGFRPELTELGLRHPVTEGLQKLAPKDGWGRWFRIMEVIPRAGEVLMHGPENLPLLVLAREGEGRVAVLASDQAWLWGRGYEGGGPQLELLRRLAHWMLKEPELEEEALVATVSGTAMTVTRRTVRDAIPGPVVITAPDGTKTELALKSEAPGRHRAVWAAPGQGLYRLEQDGLVRVVGVGPGTPREYDETLATAEVLAPALVATGGGALAISDGIPTIRTVREGRPAVGRGWIGITPRGAFEAADLRRIRLLPAWAVLFGVMGLALIGWLVEGRRARV